MTDQELLQGIARIAKDAGEEILAVYNDDAPLDVSLKEDNSPLTLADSKAHKVIVAGLKQAVFSAATRLFALSRWFGANRTKASAPNATTPRTRTMRICWSI